jgi:CrcB protein
VSELAAIAVGGAIGTVLRAATAELIPVTPGHWPWATFLVNVIGAAILGAAMTALASRHGAWPYWAPLVGTGFCGGLTTFSTMQVETVRLVRFGSFGLAAAYAVVSVMAGLVAVQAASAAVRHSEESR